MEQNLERLAQKGYGVILWKTRDGWLAALVSRQMDMIPGTTIGNYKPTAAEAVERLVQKWGMT